MRPFSIGSSRGSRSRLTAVLVASLVVPAGVARAGGPAKGKTITVSYAGSAAANADSFGAAISRNGRFVAFVSNATNLTVPAGNGMGQVMVFDRTHGTIELVSQLGGFPANQGCNRAAISANGRYVTFSTPATNLVPGANSKVQVYRADRKTHQIARVSQNAAGVAADQDAALSPSAISANGRFVVFTSPAANLTAAGGNTKQQAYRRDMNGTSLELVTATPTGALGTGDTTEARLSDNGKLVVFDSIANDLTADDQNPARDVFVRDVKKGVTRLVSRAKNGGAANAACSRGVISGNGKFVAFSSAANTLVAGDTNGVSDAFVVERKSGAIRRFAIDLSDEAGVVDALDISRNGAKLACDVNERNGAGTDDDLIRSFIVTAANGKHAELTVDPSGQSSPTHSPPPPLPAISGNGKYVAFQSIAANLGADQDSKIDIFLRRP